MTTTTYAAYRAARSARIAAWTAYTNASPDARDDALAAHKIAALAEYDAWITHKTARAKISATRTADKDRAEAAAARATYYAAYDAE